jgi:hypothetical protein
MGDIAGGKWAGIIVDHSADAGTITEIAGGTGFQSSGVIDFNENFWFVWFAMETDGTVTSWDVRISPAGATSPSGSIDVAGQGSAVFDRIEVFKYTQTFALPAVDPSIDPIAKAQVPAAGVFPKPMVGNSIDQGLNVPRGLDKGDWTAVGSPPRSRNIVGYDGVDLRGWTVTDDDAAAIEGIQQSASFPGSINHTYVVQLYIKKETTETGIYHVMRLISSSSNVYFDAFKGEIIRADAWKHQIVKLGVHDYSDTYWLVWFQFEASAASGLHDFASAQFNLWVAAGDPYNRAESTLATTTLLTGSAGIDQITMHKDYTEPHYGLVNAQSTSLRFIVVGGNDENFYSGEIAVVDGQVVGEISGAPVLENADATLDDTWTLGVIEDARQQIQKVPGTGDMRGVVQYESIVYASRNIVNGKNIDGGIWKSSTAGWVPVHVISTAIGSEARAVFNPKITFNTGLVEPSVGDIIQDHGAVNKARVLRVVKSSGSWGVDAAGFIITSYFEDGINSTWATGDILDAAGTTTLATSSAGAPQLRAPNGRYEYDIDNFFGHAKREAIYGANGVDMAIELHPDGQQEILTNIESGMTTDKPTHLAAWNNYLWLSFLGGSVQNSGLGDPLTWSAILGTDEIGIGEEISAFLTEKDEALVIFGREGTNVLYDDGSSFVIKPLENESGCIPYTAQKIFRGYYLDDMGITRTDAVLSYGNFKAASISDGVDSLINTLRVFAVSSHVSRRKNLYRLSFNDANNTNMVVGFVGNKVTGITTTNLGIPILVAHSREDDQGVERIFAGSDDGYIYELDSGNSLDGANIDFTLNPAFHHTNSPEHNKIVRGVSLDIVTRGKATFTVTPEFEYGEIPTLDVPGEVAITTQKNTLVKLRIDGDGTNYRNKISGAQNDEPPWEIHGQTIQYSGRRLDREERTS